MEITRCLARHQAGAVAALVCVLGTMMICYASSPANAQTPTLLPRTNAWAGA